MGDQVKPTLLEHPVPPLFDESSTRLILGTFPSVKSREGRFFYHHPQNRFWMVMAQVFNAPIPLTIEEKKKLLLTHHIALWDVVQFCTVEGSSDSSIRNVIPTDLSVILHRAEISQIFANGDKAYRLYHKYSYEKIGLSIIKLPSTSPANASWSLNRLVEAWKVIR